MGELGLVGLPYPKEVGGQGADYLSYVLAVEEISKVDASMGIGYSVVTSLYGGGIMNSAAPVEKKRILRGSIIRKMLRFLWTDRT